MGSRSRAAWAWTTSLAVVALIGGGLVWLGLARPSLPPRPPDADPSSSAAVGLSERRHSSGSPAPPAHRDPEQGLEDLIRGPVLPQAEPVSVAVPRIEVTSALVGLGLEDDGAMEVPREPGLAGWFRLGPTPGALGPAVIAGHVTWNGTPGVFFDLARLRPGDEVRVARADRREAVFEVDRVARFAKRRFPTEAVFGAVDHAALRLITCGGTYDASAHRYEDNVIVFASLVSVRRPDG